MQRFYQQYSSSGRYRGHPTDEVGGRLESRLKSLAVGEITLFPALPEDAGTYLCEVARVSDASSGTQILRKSFGVSVGTWCCGGRRLTDGRWVIHWERRKCAYLLTPSSFGVPTWSRHSRFVINFERTLNLLSLLPPTLSACTTSKCHFFGFPVFFSLSAVSPAPFCQLIPQHDISHDDLSIDILSKPARFQLLSDLLTPHLVLPCHSQIKPLYSHFCNP